jgi:type II secretory pathway pseudopilin PulG
MLTRSRFLALSALVVFGVSCSKKYSPQSISKEAAAVFGRAEVVGIGGSLVVDAEVLRELGFVHGGKDNPNAELIPDLAIAFLPALAAEAMSHPKDAAYGKMMARAAVLIAVTRDWPVWPSVQRLGVVAQLSALKPEQMADNVLVLLAVKGSEGENLELLQGLGAAVRTTTGAPGAKLEGGTLCLESPATKELASKLCAHAGPGFFALGTPEALASLANPVTAAADRDSGPLLRVMVRVPSQGSGELRVEGHGALKVSGAFEPSDSKVADLTEKALREGLKMVDAQREKTRAAMTTALGEVQQSMAADADAPSKLKGAVAAATLERILDPRGEYEALRKSMQIGRKGTVITAEVTFSEDQVKRYARLDGQLTGVAMIGVLSAVAIPNFVKYQCRARQSEASSALKQAFTLTTAYRIERGEDPGSLELAGYQASPGAKYALCTRGGCAPSEIADAESACAEILGRADTDGPLACAVGQPSGAGLDTWSIDAKGEITHHSDGCR